MLENNKTKHILIVDDDQICLLGIEMLLFETSFVIKSALGGEEGLKYLKTYPQVDLILLDLMMPDIHGLRLLEIIRQDSKLKNIPVIIQTGVVTESEHQKAIALGAVEVLRKPYNKETLFKAIARIFES